MAFVDVVVLSVVNGCTAGVNIVVVAVVVQIMAGVLVIMVINAVVLGGIVLMASGFDAINILISFRRFEWKSNCASAVNTSDTFNFA